MKKNVCICGGGNLGHVVAGVLANSSVVSQVSLLTNRPEKWSQELTIDVVPVATSIKANLACVSANAEEVIPEADIVILCLPAFCITNQLKAIRPFLKKDAFVGCVFSSTGFFFQAIDVLGTDVRLWGFQRVPFIARVNEYGSSASLLGYKNELKMAVENCSDFDKEAFRAWAESAFSTPTFLLNNYLEASITNSNPLLHTSRLYGLFSWLGDPEGMTEWPLFYEEWTEEDAQLYIDMDNELFQLIDKLPVSKNFLQPVLPYYESTDAKSLAKKISSIPSFKGIYSPMKEVHCGIYSPDYSSRYFTEDFGYGLKYIWELTKKYNVNAPNIDKVYRWGASKINC